jgi:hypothetical protein
VPGHADRLPIAVVQLRAGEAAAQVVVGLYGRPFTAQVRQAPGACLEVVLGPGTTRQSSVLAPVRFVNDSALSSTTLDLEGTSRLGMALTPCQRRG